jgi:Tol biopolymer transport system component
MVLFIDKAGDDEVAQIYGVDVGQLDGELLPVVPVYETIGFRSPDQTVVARPDEADGNLMLFTNEQTGQAWTIDTRGNWPVFSPDSRQIFWNVTDRDGPYDERRTDIWAANIDGSEVRMLLSLYGGGAERWFPDGQKLLVIGRAERVGEQERLFVLSIADGTTVELAQEDRLRVGDISPDGAWAIYLSTFAVDPTHNGLFAVRTDGTELRPLDFIGPFRWREADRLLYIPTRASAEDSLVVWELDMTTGEAQPLTDPAQIRFTIDGADWALSPDGRKLVFVSSEDQNLWLINLPE